MSDVDVLQLFRDTAAEVEERDFSEVERGTRLSDLGIDSVSMMEIVGCMEDDLDVRIPQEALSGVQTVGDVEKVVRARLDG